MKLVLAYYNKENPALIKFETFSIFSRFLKLDDYLCNSNGWNELKTDLYTLMIEILSNYYGDKYRNEVVENQEEYTAYFKRMFVYSYEVV